MDTTILFDPSNNTCKAGPQLPDGRRGHVGVLLDDGRVLLAGGLAGAVNGVPSDTAALFAASNNTVAAVSGVMSSTRSQVFAIKLLDGRVWVAGGYNNAYLSSTNFFK